MKFLVNMKPIKKRYNMETIERKSLLYKSKVEYSDYCVNHIEGCAHGCMFPCYAFGMAKRFGKVDTYENWIKPKLVSNSLELLDKEIPKFKKDIKFVHICFMTDPFMFDHNTCRVFPEVQDMSIKIIKKLNKNNIRVVSLTKGIYPISLQDQVIGSEVIERDKKTIYLNKYGITLVSLNKDFLSKYEPYAAPVRDRIASLRRLSEAGCFTWVSIEPYPTPNIVDQSLDDLLYAVDFADMIVFGRLNYNGLVSQYKDHKMFYAKCVNKVRKFCRDLDIICYIQKSTSLHEEAKLIL